MRYTVVNLRDDVAKINHWLTCEGIPTRLLVGGRYGYQAIDEYSVDANGERIGSGVNRNVETGSSRDCMVAAYAYYSVKHKRG